LGRKAIKRDVVLGGNSVLFSLAFEKREAAAIGKGSQSKLEEWEERDGVFLSPYFKFNFLFIF